MNLNNLTIASWIQQALFTRPMAEYFNPLLEVIEPTLSLDQFRARVAKVDQLNADVASIRMEVPAAWPGFKPGQYVSVQFDVDGVVCKRSYSISSTPALLEEKNCIEVTVHRVEGGVVSGYVLDELAVGEVLVISEAAGELVMQAKPGKEGAPVVYIAGGSGITPVASLIGSNAAAGRPEFLFYSAKSGCHIFQDRLEQAAGAKHDFTFLKNETGGRGSGRLTGEQMSKACPDIASAEIFLCGPGAFVDSMKAMVGELGVPDSSIHSEAFDAGPVVTGNEPGEVYYSQSKRCSSGTGTILQQAEEAGLQPGSGCRMGICHTCTCRKTSGVVIDARTGEESSADEEEIRICVSIPKGSVEIEI